MSSTDLNVYKPVSIWNKEIKIAPKELFTNIGKMVIKGASMNFEGISETLLDTFNAAGLKDKPGEVAWLLIYRALMGAIQTIVENHKDLFYSQLDETQLDQISKSFEKAMNNIEIAINSDFFDRPTDLPFLDELQAPFAKWLQNLNMKPETAQVVSKKLKRQFVFALQEKWREKPEDYAMLIKHFDSPFTKANDEERGWMLYYLQLQSLIEDRMFGEIFGVSKVYVPLRRYYVKIPKEKQGIEPDKGERIVIDLEKDIENWLEKFNQKTAVRLISGGPGSGKSTFAKVLAARLSQKDSIPVLYIPLHLLDLSASLVDAVKKYVSQNRYLKGSPLDVKKGKDRLLLIMDGLDELAMMGKAALDVAGNFIEEVIRTIHNQNAQGLKRQVLVTGRDLAIQTVANKFREEKQICSVLPYSMQDYEKKNYTDPNNYLKEDQRDRWWKQYGQVKGKQYDKIPDALEIETLFEITCQPLLNYLVALSYERNKIRFTLSTTLNEIYSDLISAVFERQYEAGRRQAYVGDLVEDQFVRILEEIALAIFHGDGKTASIDKIFNQCSRGGIECYLEQVQERAKNGLMQLLTAFYFRKSDRLEEGDPTFEFTHKSFGEYLTARRIIRLLEKIQQNFDRRRKDPEDGWSIHRSLKEWAELCGPTMMDRYLFNFIKDEVLLKNPKDIRKWQNSLSQMLSHTINMGVIFKSCV